MLLEWPQLVASSHSLLCSSDHFPSRCWPYQFLSTQEEASDLLNTYHWEEEEVDPVKIPPPRLVWDPAEEDPSVEFFPTFEATGIDPAR